MANKAGARPKIAEKGQPGLRPIDSVRGKLSSKGQITIPVDVRKRLGLHEGDQVDFVFEKGQMVLRPARSEENPFAKWVGAAGAGFKNEADVIRWQREMRGYDEWDEKDLGL